uniref:Uncharacterized protein n=1 Tax=Arundo donax TaxID=35708 RepID=A0A0A9AJ02_ARUDO
MLQHLFLCL